MNMPTNRMLVSSLVCGIGCVLACLILTLAVSVRALAQPGVRSFQKISDTEGGFTGILNDGDQFCITCGLGDLDGDGVEDMAVGAIGDDDGGNNRGAVWILFLDADGTVKSYQKISDWEGSFGGVLDNGDNFGWHIASLGDLDGNGPAAWAIAVGAIYDDDGGTDAGAVWILFLNSDGTVAYSQKISAAQGNFFGELEAADNFGYYVAALSDLDGDGIGDLAVGAPRDDDGGYNRGAVYILFLNENGTVRAHQKISAEAGGFNGALPDSCHFGQSVAFLDDLNGDAVDDLAVGTPLDNDGGQYQGTVWILFLNSDGTVVAQQKISDTEGGFTGDLDDSDHFGETLAALGDFDHDGVADLAVGANGDDDGGVNRGALWLLFLNPDGTVKFNEKISDTEGGFYGTLDDEDWFSVTPSPLGDLDGDGVLDLAVGANFDDDGGDARGAVWVLLLTTDLTEVDDDLAAAGGLPSRLGEVSPNPASGFLHYSVELDEATFVDIGLFDVTGRRVLDLMRGELPGGAHSLSARLARDGAQLGKGIYYLRMKAGGRQWVRAVAVVR